LVGAPAGTGALSGECGGRCLVEGGSNGAAAPRRRCNGGAARGEGGERFLSYRHGRTERHGRKIFWIAPRDAERSETAVRSGDAHRNLARFKFVPARFNHDGEARLQRRIGH
jgi:hypothetical protein